MLQEAIEKNRGFLKVCAAVAVIVGVAGLIGIVWIGLALVLSPTMGEGPLKSWQVQELVKMGLSAAAIALKAMVAFALASFILWMLNPTRQQGWILRRVDRCIYLYVGLRLLNSIFAMWTAKTSGESTEQDHIINILHIVYFVAFQVLWVVPWVLVGIAAGKGVMLIEESKKRKVKIE